MISGLLENAANLVGISEPALRLLLCIFLGFPGAIFYRKVIFPLPKLHNHLYFIFAGLALCAFNFGTGVVHSLISVVATYLMVRFLPRGWPLRAAAFTFHMAHLLAGYYTTETDLYDIEWTTPHCVLVLRLIGLCFDVCDTHEWKQGAPKKEMDYYGIEQTPNLVEIAAYVYFPAAFLAGPQFPYRLFERFMNKEFAKYEGYQRAAIIRFAQGALYLALHQACGLIINNDGMVSSELAHRSLFVRLLLLGVFGKYTFYKYIAVWLMSEGNAIRYGLTFRGFQDPETKQKPDWSACANIDVRLFEMATKFDHYIQSFNINTNRWAARHVFKRLVFLGNKDLSQLLTLVFLAVWHGFHSGYYVTFLFEFIVVHIDRDAARIRDANDTLRTFCQKPVMVWLLFAVQKFYAFVGLGWCIVPFGLLAFEKYWIGMRNISFVGIWFFGGYAVLRFVALALFPPSRKKNKESSGVKAE